MIGVLQKTGQSFPDIGKAALIHVYNAGFINRLRFRLGIRQAWFHRHSRGHLRGRLLLPA